jgi:hypothetical protein
MRFQIPITILMTVWLPLAAFGHGGDGIDHGNPAGLAQMPSSLSDAPAGPANNVAIEGQINSAKPSISSVGGGGGGAPGSEISEGPPGPSLPPPLAQPGTVPNNTVKSVPDKPGMGGGPINLDRVSGFYPRTTDSLRIYEKAYNADFELMQKWRQSFGR